jgi:thiol-disulfide isomerase/thioredoxin
MSRRATLLLALTVLAGLPGCRVFERLGKDKDNSAEPTARTKDKDWLRERQDREPGGPPKDWLAGPATPGRGDRVPPADSWADPASRGAQRTLSGVIEDADGRPIPGAYVTVENADPIKAGYGAPMGVESGRDGLFEINGLAASEHYMLSSQITREGKPQAGRISVQVPNNRIRLRLKEDYQLPPSRGREASDLPPTVPVGGVAPKVFDTPGSTSPDTNPDNHQWSPLGPGGKKIDDTPPPPPPPRSDLTAPGPAQDWRSTMPPANIPGPGVAPTMPSPTVPTIPPLNSGPTSKALPREAKLTLLGGDGRARNVLSGRPDDLVLLDFMTTTCLPCKRAIPSLMSFHEKYGKNVEVVAVVCDSGSDSRRVDSAAAYRREQHLPYAVNSENSRSPVQDAFNIEAYPTLVLLDGTGRRLWKGHPKDIAEAERIIRNR